MSKNFAAINDRGEDAFVSGSRVILGLFLVVIGVMTFFVPDFRGAFNVQLGEAGIPLRQFTRFVIPVVEATAGAMLLGGILPRIASLATIVLMALITYLHLVVPEPAMFPLHFGLPLIPIIALVLAGFLYFVEGDLEEEVI